MKATYHQDATTRITLDVLENKNGLATLGREKEILVTGVVISDDGAPGTCTLQTKAAKTAKGKVSKAEAKAIEDAEAALEDAKAAALADPDNADLAAAVNAAQEALDALLA